MTIDEIVTFVTNKIGLTDADSADVCATFVNRRYQMIYDQQDWVDSIDQALVIPVVGIRDYDLPTTLERIKTLADPLGRLIEPATFQFINESYPELLLVGGPPKFYVELTVNGVRKFRLFPFPATTMGNLVVNGKRTFAPLTTGQTPILRNIDNALIAYVYADMLQRMRQFAKAKEVQMEADAALQLMVAVEKARANVPRMSKHVTVSGDSLEEMSDAVACRIGDYSQETRIVVQELMRRNYNLVYDSQLWPESKCVVELDRDGSEIVLPEYVDKIISVRFNASLATLAATDESLVFDVSPQMFDQIGTPGVFMRLTPVGVPVLPPILEALEFVSDSDGDIESNMTLYGEANGVEVREVVTLNGETPVVSGYPYDTPITWAKRLTLGIVTVIGADSRVFLGQLMPDERERKHQRLWLQPTPQTGQATKCLLLGKRKIRPLINDQDTPLFSGMANILIQMTVGDMLMKSGDKAGGQDARAQAKAALDAMLDREIKQAAYSQRVTPVASGYGNDCNGSFYDSLNFI